MTLLQKKLNIFSIVIHNQWSVIFSSEKAAPKEISLVKIAM